MKHCCAALQVQQVRTRINDYVSQGGIKPVHEEKSKMAKGMAVLMGKATLSDFDKSDEQIAAEKTAAEQEHKK